MSAFSPEQQVLIIVAYISGGFSLLNLLFQFVFPIKRDKAAKGFEIGAGAEKIGEAYDQILDRQTKSLQEALGKIDALQKRDDERDKEVEKIRLDASVEIQTLREALAELQFKFEQERTLRMKAERSNFELSERLRNFTVLGPGDGKAMIAIKEPEKK